MVNNYIQFFDEFEKEFEQMKNSIANPIIQAQELVRFAENKLKLLNQWLRKHKFENNEQEIYFFKVLKPSLVSKIIYYTCLIKTESTLPANKKERIKHFNKKLNRIHDFIEQNNQFLIYYRSNSSACDEEYFIRKPFTNNFDQNDLAMLNFDERISTSHDYLMAQMMVSDMLTEYLEKAISKCKKRKSDDFVSPFTWTGTQTDIVEMAYAIHHTGVINNGAVNIKEFAVHLAKSLNANLDGNKVYDTYHKIKSRKTEPTKFMNRATKKLQNAILEESFR